MIADFHIFNLAHQYLPASNRDSILSLASLTLSHFFPEKTAEEAKGVVKGLMDFEKRLCYDQGFSTFFSLYSLGVPWTQTVKEFKNIEMPIDQMAEEHFAEYANYVSELLKCDSFASMNNKLKESSMVSAATIGIILMILAAAWLFLKRLSPEAREALEIVKQARSKADENQSWAEKISRSISRKGTGWKWEYGFDSLDAGEKNQAVMYLKSLPGFSEIIINTGEKYNESTMLRIGLANPYVYSTEIPGLKLTNDGRTILMPHVICGSADSITVKIANNTQLNAFFEKYHKSDFDNHTINIDVNVCSTMKRFFKDSLEDIVMLLCDKSIDKTLHYYRVEPGQKFDNSKMVSTQDNLPYSAVVDKIDFGMFLKKNDKIILRAQVSIKEEER